MSDHKPTSPDTRTVVLSESGKLAERYRSAGGVEIWGEKDGVCVLHPDWPVPARGWHCRIGGGEIDFGSLSIEVGGCCGGDSLEGARLAYEPEGLRWAVISYGDDDGADPGSAVLFTYIRRSPEVPRTKRQRDMLRSVIYEVLDLCLFFDNRTELSEVVLKELNYFIK